MDSKIASNIWNIVDGKKEFTMGQAAYEEVARIAGECPDFTTDVEEEWVTDEERSCYNCKLRRWTTTSFTCMADI
jgi:hypothetical protein